MASPPVSVVVVGASLFHVGKKQDGYFMRRYAAPQVLSQETIPGMIGIETLCVGAVPRW